MKSKNRSRCIYAFALFFICFVFGINVNGYGQGLSNLAEKTSDSILNYFNDKYNVKASIIRYENFSGVSDLTAQKFYQLVVARLEASPAVQNTPGGMTYIDLMINFSKNKGEFNLNRIHQLNHLIYIKLTRNKNKVGAGISIFSRISDRLVYIKYVETVFSTGERELFETSRLGFKNTGFSKIVELDADPGLLDFRTYQDAQGQLRYLFYYSDKIELFQPERNRLSKSFTYPLEWGKAYFPAMQSEGRLAVFSSGSKTYITAGNNFSRFSRVLVVNDGEWREMGSVDFVPFRLLHLNDIVYITGARYALGKNYFQGQLLLAPFEDLESGRLMREKASYPYLEKIVLPFYALDFSINQTDNTLDSIHLVDREYNYRFLADNFEPLTAEGEASRGAALCAIDGLWLAVSDYSRGYDTLFFYRIESGRRQLVFKNSISGEIVFISDGMWKAARGFWVYVRLTKGSGSGSASGEYKLQFWSKKSE